MSSEDDWSRLLKDFCRLGGIAENISNKEGKCGRGIFPKDPSCRSKIFTPKSLLVKADCLKLKGDYLSISSDSGLSSEQKDFTEFYYNLFSWGDQGNCASVAFLKELGLLPEAIRKTLLDSRFIAYGQLGLNADCQDHVLKRFIAERYVRFEGELVLAPIWELINHSAFSPSLRVTSRGVETPPLPPSDSEILLKYSAKNSPIGMWKKYGFACKSVFAYSVPLRVKVDSLSFAVQCDGGQQTLTAGQGGNVKVGGELIVINSLIVGCLSRGLPLSALGSMLKTLPLSEVDILKLLREIQDTNLTVRRALLSSLEPAGLNRSSALQNALKYEIELIQGSM